jgi:hypothetical protein
VPTYIAEDFSAAEADILRRYFTNLDHRTVARSAIPIGAPGCPELAF